MSTPTIVTRSRGNGDPESREALPSLAGCRFGIGDVTDAKGEKRSRQYVEALADEVDARDLDEYRGLAGGHTILAEREFEFVIE